MIIRRYRCDFYSIGIVIQLFKAITHTWKWDIEVNRTRREEIENKFSFCANSIARWWFHSINLKPHRQPPPPCYTSIKVLKRNAAIKAKTKLSIEIEKTVRNTRNDYIYMLDRHTCIHRWAYSARRIGCFHSNIIKSIESKIVTVRSVLCESIELLYVYLTPLILFVCCSSSSSFDALINNTHENTDCYCHLTHTHMHTSRTSVIHFCDGAISVQFPVSSLALASNKRK